MAAARRQAGLDDFGARTFDEGLRELLESWEQQAGLSLLGRLMARTQVIELLANRLRSVDVMRRHPEIERERIERPIFIIGMPRTGTSILHELLARDPGLRVPLSWEVDRPCPPPETATYESDP